MLKFTMLVILLAAPVALAALARYPAEEKPACYADQEGCWFSQLGRVLPYNEPQYPYVGTKCDLFLCQDSGEVLEETCGVIAIQEGCTRAAGNLSLTYPDCCDTQKC